MRLVLKVVITAKSLNLFYSSPVLPTSAEWVLNLESICHHIVVGSYFEVLNLDISTGRCTVIHPYGT